MSSRSAVIVATAVAVAAVTGLAPAPAVAGPTSDPDLAADYGAGWLARQVGPDGSVTGAFGACDGEPDVALALAAAGVGGGAFDRVVARLEADGAACAGTSPGALGKVILLAVAAGRDPSAFGGSQPANDLVARLLATMRATGDDAGLYGSADPTFDGAFRQSLALLGLVAASATPPAEAVAWLLGQQCDDGGWQAYRAPGAACDPTNIATFTGEDTNSTAMAVQAMAAVGQTTSAADGLDFLDAARNASGGWGFYADQATDANSTGLGIQAIVAGGENPTAGRWTTAGTPVAALLALQIGCEGVEADRGAFAYQPMGGALDPDVIATAQAVPGAARRPFPLGTSTLSATEPAVSCGGGSGGGGGTGGTGGEDTVTDGSTGSPRPALPTTRLAGGDRYATAAAVSAATYAPGVDTVHVASGEVFADALTAAAPAGRGGGPVLLTATSTLPRPTIDELRRLQPRRVVVVGGPAAVDDRVLEELRAAGGWAVERVAGSDRFATAAALSIAVAPGVAEVHVATGETFADALAAGAAAARRGTPVLLTRRDTLPDATRDALRRLQPGRVTLVGGTAAVSPAVEDALRAHAPTVERVAGADRYATAAALATRDTSDTSTAWIASGEDFADALAAAAPSARSSSPLLLVARACTPPATGAALDRVSPEALVVVGGSDAVGDEAVQRNC